MSNVPVACNPPRQSAGPPPGFHRNTWILLSAIVAGVAVLLTLILKPAGLRDQWQLSWSATVLLLFLVGKGTIWLGLIVYFRPAKRNRRVRIGPVPPYGASEYAAFGLGPLPEQSDSAQLYIDLIKRSVVNVLYEDEPAILFGDNGRLELAREFDLEKRVNGDDAPTQAHTMIGLRRLNNIQSCVEAVIKNGTPGDFAEAGSFRGGATIFMRALLKAHQITDRRVFVCDAFVSPQPQLPPWPFMPFIQALVSIPGRSNKRRIFRFLERMPQATRAFPLCDNPSDEWIDFVLWALRHPEVIKCGDSTSRAHVESRFARYGLLDEQVVFLEGYFADTLPNAPIERLSMIRLDGDTYESTRDSIEHLYPKLTPGGFCIIDDYQSFLSCKQAVTEYRQKHGIEEAIQLVDHAAVFWQKALD